MPSAPPICCDVLISPEARPASFACDARERRDRDRDEREPHAQRDHEEARQQVAEVGAPDGDLREVQEADGEEAHPRHEHRLDADPRHECWATIDQTITLPATAMYAKPVFIAEYPSTCCM